MSTGFYSDMQNIASGLLSDFDQSRGSGQQNDGIWYVAVTPGNGPADHPGAPTETYHKLNGVARGVSQKYVDGTLILATDEQCTVAIVPGLSINVTGFIERDGKRCKIVKVMTIPPAGEPVATVIIYRG